MNNKELLSVCFTGTCPNHTRTELMEMVAGKYEVKDSVTKGLDILVCADPNAGSSKLQKAEKNGVKIMSYEDFLGMLENGAGDKENAEPTKQDEKDDIRKQADAYLDKKDYQKALELYLKLADQNDTMVWRCIAFCYYQQEDYADAIRWWQKAAEQGEAGAQRNLAICYEYGEGVEKDLTKAVEWYTKAAEQGDAYAQFNLANCYKNGEGVIQNFEKAVEWYTKAAEQGDADAQCNLGLSYRKGEGVMQNFEKAIEWYTKAAEQGNAAAQNNLAYCYEIGLGVEANDEVAVKWYTKAAEQGVDQAQEALKKINSDSKNIFDYLTFKITSDTTVAVEKCSNSPRKLSIPEEIELDGKKYVVTELGDKCFDYCQSLISIKMPNTVERLGEKCFSLCTNLAAVQLSESLTVLEDQCFQTCTSLTKINLPESIEWLGDSCFESCSSLKSIHLPSKIEGMGFACFECSGLTTIELPNTLTSLPDMCFEYCSFTSIHLPDSITELGDRCFYSCLSLTSIHLPDSITELGDKCFEDCYNLTSVHLPESVKLGDECFRACGRLENINLSKTVVLGNRCFKDCDKLKVTKTANDDDEEESFDEEELFGKEDYELYYDITSDTTCEVRWLTCNLEFGTEEKIWIYVPEWQEIDGKKYQVTALADECFYERNTIGTDLIEGVHLPDSIKTIGDYCLEGSGIDSIDIPEGVTSLGKACFSTCLELETISLPDTLIALGDECFSHCSSLTSVTLPESVKFIGYDIFKESDIRYVKKEDSRLHFLFKCDDEDAISSDEWLREYYRKKELNTFAVNSIVEKLKDGNPASELLVISNVGTDCCELSLVKKEGDDNKKGKTLWKAIYTTVELEANTEDIKATIAEAFAEVTKG